MNPRTLPRKLVLIPRWFLGFFTALMFFVGLSHPVHAQDLSWDNSGYVTDITYDQEGNITDLTLTDQAGEPYVVDDIRVSDKLSEKIEAAMENERWVDISGDTDGTVTGLTVYKNPPDR